jgi:pyruvate,water dikinase
LSSRDVHRLWELGKRISEHFGAPQDIEWAFHDGNLFLLQSRPITTHRETEAAEALARATRQRLREEMSAGRGPWVVHNLAETLPHPTALTWSVIRKFMSGLGGFGAMYRQAGFQPAPIIDREGFLELVAGRIYMDAARAPEMFCENFPFAYDLEKLVHDPDASQKPPTLPRGSYSLRAKAAALLSKAGAKLQGLAGRAAGEFREKTTPAVTEYVARSREKNLRLLTVEQLIAFWEEYEKQILNVFGRDILMPGLICGMAWAELETFLQENFWDDDTEALLRIISVGGEADRTVIADAELFKVASGKWLLETWLADHGHRGPGELDLAAPRWREQPEVLRERRRVWPLASLRWNGTVAARLRPTSRQPFCGRAYRLPMPGNLIAVSTLCVAICLFGKTGRICSCWVMDCCAIWPWKPASGWKLAMAHSI